MPTSTQAFNLASSVQPTAAPELESGESDSPASGDVELELSPATITPSLASSSLSLEDLDNDFTLASSVISPASESSSESPASASSRGKLTFTRPSRTFTPVIRPSLFNRPRNRANPVRSRGRSRTTVAIITRSDVTPTLIATPASSPLPQSSPSIEASSSVFNRARSSVRGSISSSSINPSRSSLSSSIAPTSASEIARNPNRPSIISGLSLRRPNPFRARLKERQRANLQRLRTRGRTDSNDEAEEEEDSQPEAPSTTPAPKPSITPPRFPVGIPGRTPIFVSSRTENIKRNPKEVGSTSRAPTEPQKATTSSGDSTSDNTIRVPSTIQALRERARSRIESLFRRRRPTFNRPRPGGSEAGADPLIVQESRKRRKRQASSSYSDFGTRTRARQSYVRGTRTAQNQPQYFQSLNDPPFTAFRNPYTTTYQAEPAASTTAAATSYQTQPSSAAASQYADYDSDSSYYSSSQDSVSNVRTRKQAISSSSSSSRSPREGSSTVRKVRQDDLSGSTRSRSRFRSRSRLPSRGSSSFRTTTTTSRPPLRSRFRPKSRKVNSGSGSRFSSNSGRFGSSSSFNSDFDYDYDYDYDNTDLQSSQSSVPTVITVTHTVPLRTVIPVRENGRETFKEVITTSPSLQVIQATDLKSTNIDGSPVIYANTKTATPAPGTKVVTFEALRATETTTVTFTPTRIRGLRTKASAVVPSTIYNIKPVTTSSVTPVDNNQLLTQLLLQLLGNQQTPLTNTQPQPAAVPQLNQLLPNLGISPSPPQTQFITHTSTYVTTVTNVKSTVLPITLRGREIKTTLVESSTEVATVTELSTETIQPAPTQAALPILPTAAAAPSPAGVNTNCAIF